MREDKVPLAGGLKKAVAALQAVLDRRIAFRLAIIVAGMMHVGDRRTASAWLIAAGVHDHGDRFYDCLISIGWQAEKLAAVVLTLVVQEFSPVREDRFLLGIDDTPTRRNGRHVEGAGVHHDPTPGPAGGEWLYGHTWVSRALLTTHRLWGVIALPLRSLRYVRAVDVPKLDEKHGWIFRTKHELAAERVLRFVAAVRSLRLKAKVWVVTDGGYTARPFLATVLHVGVVVVSRLRKDAKRFDLLGRHKPSQRARPRIYGEHRIDLAKHATHPRGWQSLIYWCRGEEVTRQYKTFLATSRLVGGVIRVVIVCFEDGGRAAYLGTDETAEMRDVLESVASRWALEEHFHDVKKYGARGSSKLAT